MPTAAATTITSFSSRPARIAPVAARYSRLPLLEPNPKACVLVLSWGAGLRPTWLDETGVLGPSRPPFLAGAGWGVAPNQIEEPIWRSSRERRQLLSAWRNPPP